MKQEQNQANPEYFCQVGGRLRAARADMRIARQADLGLLLGGIPRTTISRTERGENLPGAELLRALVQICGLNINWLLTGEGEMWLRARPPLPRPAVAGATPPRAEANAVAGFRVKEVYEAGFRVIPREDVPPGPRAPGLVPVLGRIAAGAGAETLEAVQYAPGDADAYLIYKGAPEGAVAVQVVGASMEPDFREGDLVVVDAGGSAESGLACIVQRSGDVEVARLKRLRRVGRRLILESANPAFPPEDLPRRDFVAARPVLAHLPLSRRTKGGGP